MLIASMVVAIVVAVLWLGIVALATPTVVYRLDRRFDLASREFESAVANALGATPVNGGFFVSGVVCRVARDEPC